ncbi:MAG: hypothetical protein ACPLZD_08355 [Candidatus Saccharicenans sp.]|nr:MAG: hypothetical protein C0168_04975 [Candidatus Aminicenantes bacterium]
MLMKKMDIKANDRKPIYIDYFAGLGREKSKIHEPKNPISPSLLFSLKDDERTKNFIIASFLPFFALLSIPPSFN